MTSPTPSRTDLYQAYSHRSMILILALALLVGGLTLVVFFDPDGVVAHGLPRAAVLVPIAIALSVAGLYATLRGQRWEPSAPDGRAVLEDEWRQQSLTRALRGAFGVVLAAQAPLAVCLAGRPGPESVVAMAIVTMCLGLATLSGLFLVFDRRGSDAG